MAAADLPTDEIHELIVAGRMLDAWELARATGIDLKAWPQGEARRTAARLANVLGSQKLSRVLDWLNWNHDRQHPRYYFHALYARASYVPECALIPEVTAFLENHPQASAAGRADLLAFLAGMLASLRDFAPANRHMQEALELSGDDAWIHVMHASVLERADRYEEALAAARHAITLRPWYAAALLQCAGNLVHLGRDDEAIALLEHADRSTQNAAFAMRLQAMFSEREDHARALQCLETAEQRSPLAEASLTRWIAGRRADFLYMAGDVDGCLEWCERKGEGFHQRTAENLRKPGARDRKRVRLDVPFTRQHSMTCAPATLASLAAYWNQPQDHLAIAEAICHDGTPWHKERKWARDQGFVTREFRLTHDALTALVDRGVPFTLTTQAATSAHLQACIGYDDRCGIILIRDPTERHFVEMFLDRLLEEHPFAGPRCMILIPPGEAHRLDGLNLADEAAYDAYHELLVALDSNDRFQIESALSTLRAVSGDSPLVLEGEERVAMWRDDPLAHLRVSEAQLAIAPQHAATRLQKASLLRRLDRWQDLRKWLEESLALPHADPVFTSELGELLLEDARLLPEAEPLLRKAVRQRRRDGRVHESLARCRAKQQRHVEAARLRRIASSLSATFEPYAKAYFESCRVIRRHDEALEFLTDRTRRFGHKDGAPWITLAECLVELDRETDAAGILEKGAAARPGDGTFLLDAGAMMAGWGEPYRSRGLAWMEQSRGRVPEQRWLLATARTSAFLGDRTKSLRCWRALVERQPRWIEAWRGLTHSTAEELGEDAAIKLLDEATAKHPDLVGLRALHAEWLRGTKRGPLEALDRLLEISPSDVWALRERAGQRFDAGQTEAAEHDAREALARDPWSPASHGTLGRLLERSGRKQEAADCFREAIRLNVDYTFAATRLCSLAADHDESIAALRFIHSEMERQVSNGTIVPEYQQLAWARIEPPALLDQLRRFCRMRPDLWQTWSARIEQSLRMQQDDEALEAATELSTRFPLMPRAWLELARVHRSAGRSDDEEQACRRAVDLSPGWDEAAREHSHVLEVLGRPQEAVDVLKRARRHNPLAGANHGYLADTLRRLGHHQEAFECIRGGHELCPFYAWGWEQACRWALSDNRQPEMTAALEQAAENHGHHPAWWPIAADCWDTLGEGARAIEAIHRGLELRPADHDLRDKLAYQQFSHQRFDEALAACAPVEAETEAPVNLRGRRAWILIHSGQPARGVEEMRGLLEREPHYSWGFGELATWFEDRSDWKALRDHSKRWLRAAPHHTRALACLGLAERHLEQPDAAIAAYSRAFAHDPGYTFVGRQLMDLQMETGKLDAARQTLATLRHYSDNPWILCDAIELELKQEQTDQALAAAATLIEHPSANADAFEWVARMFEKAGCGRRWNDWIRERFASGIPAAPGALAAYLRTLPPKRLLKDGQKAILRLPSNSPARSAGWEFLIQHLRKNGGAEILKKWARKRLPELHSNPQLWNAMGEALLSISASKEGLAWLADWKSRPDDVIDLTLMMVAGFHDDHPGKDDTHWLAAAEARSEGLRRFPDGPNANHLRAGHALHLATAGQHAEAAEALRNFEPDRTTDYYRALANAARAIVAAAEGDEDAAKSALTKSAGFLCQFTDLGSIRSLERGTRAVARHLPWTRGKASKLQRRWNIPKPKPRPDFLSGGIRTSWWLAIIGIFLILRACDLFLKQ
jgi:tetratricopeptide (TPR) repeat protein